MDNFKFKIYYEDTDAEGIVYYANYLKYFERARTELIYDIGLNHKKIYEEDLWKELEEFDELDVNPATKNALKDKLQEVAYKLNKEEFTW